MLTINTAEATIIKIGNIQIETKDKLTYLFNTISKDEGTIRDTQKRINQARQVFASMRKNWRIKNLNIGTIESIQPT